MAETLEEKKARLKALREEHTAVKTVISNTERLVRIRERKTRRALDDFLNAAYRYDPEFGKQCARIAGRVK